MSFLLFHLTCFVASYFCLSFSRFPLPFSLSLFPFLLIAMYFVFGSFHPQLLSSFLFMHDVFSFTLVSPSLPPSLLPSGGPLFLTESTQTDKEREGKRHAYTFI